MMKKVSWVDIKTGRSFSNYTDETDPAQSHGCSCRRSPWAVAFSRTWNLHGLQEYSPCSTVGVSWAAENFDEKKPSLAFVIQVHVWLLLTQEKNVSAHMDIFGNANKFA